MDKYVKNFIIVSIFYLAVASLFGILMIAVPDLLTLKFLHSHFMLIGWVSMMIYGVGYHILPRFAGKLVKSKRLGEVQFWVSNTGLIAMVVFYTGGIYHPESGIFMTLTLIGGFMVVLSIFMFLYNMAATLLSKAEE